MRHNWAGLTDRLAGQRHGRLRIGKGAGEGHLCYGHGIVDDFDVNIVPYKIISGVICCLLCTYDLLKLNGACVLAAVQVHINDFAKLLKEVTNTLDFEFIVWDVLDEYRKSLRVELTIL